MKYSRLYNCFVYKTATPLKIISAVKGARKINGECVAVPATLFNIQSLREIGETVSPPMQLYDYDWPIKRGWKPFQHQKVVSNYAVVNKRSFCFSDPGTMKTLSYLWAADFLMTLAERDKTPFRCLIICPLSIMRSVWADAIFRHFPGKRKYAILHGTEPQRRKQLMQDVSFYIINHDGVKIGHNKRRGVPLKGLALDLSKRTDIRAVIVDEVGAYRDAFSTRSKALRRLTESREYLWLLTGTPTPNGPLDAYGIARLMSGAGGESFASYKMRTMVQVGPWKWVPRPGSMHDAANLLQPSIRFSADLLNLPPCSAEQRSVPFSKEQNKAYNDLKRQAIIQTKSGAVITAANEAALRIKLIQICCGAIYDKEHNSHIIDAEPRVSEVEEIINETLRKVVVFASLTNALNVLKCRLSNHYECETLNGSVPEKKRVDLIRKFGDKNSDLRILLCDPGTVGHGINELVSAATIIWYCPTDKNEQYIQGNRRINRPGQIGPTKIIQLVSCPVEKEIYNRLATNASLQGVILKLAEEP